MTRSIDGVAPGLSSPPRSLPRIPLAHTVYDLESAAVKTSHLASIVARLRLIHAAGGLFDCVKSLCGSIHMVAPFSRHPVAPFGRHFVVARFAPHLAGLCGPCVISWLLANLDSYCLAGCLGFQKFSYGMGGLYA